MSTAGCPALLPLKHRPGRNVGVVKSQKEGDFGHTFPFPSWVLLNGLLSLGTRFF